MASFLEDLAKKMKNAPHVTPTYADPAFHQNTDTVANMDDFDEVYNAFIAQLKAKKKRKSNVDNKE